jgi:hypothetical protein
MVPELVMVPIEEIPAAVESIATGPEIVPLLVRLVRMPVFRMAAPSPPLAVIVPLLVIVPKAPPSLLMLACVPTRFPVFVMLPIEPRPVFPAVIEMASPSLPEAEIVPLLSMVEMVPEVVPIPLFTPMMLPEFSIDVIVPLLETATEAVLLIEEEIVPVFTRLNKLVPSSYLIPYLPPSILPALIML